ncbi:DEAD/DEAH box helicase [Candidatus Poriferisocius sp.]|uniref:DEAD/DEAH box helicase n=1 Tax=Candidatus Poriferisocius sp. TaxID=3101276 RepID=UPI003B01997A
MASPSSAAAVEAGVCADVGYGFHPAVGAWFEGRFPGGPTEAQAEGWPAIASGQDTLIAAPTGSGKTLAGFLIAIDNLYKRHAAGRTVAKASQVVYVSPLKALATDIAENLERPLAEIAEVARAQGFEPPPLTVAVRTGDTPAHTRAAMIKKPANFVVTTPESLYLLVTAAKSREVLRTVETVIVDEIHATARDKRGSHLALTLERLEHVANTRPTRIGLSATQHPIGTIADLLTGTTPDTEPGTHCTIVNTGHQRSLDIRLELFDDELEAVISHAQMDMILDRMANLIGEHHTTIVFVNTRRMSERIAHQLAERLGDDAVAAHHGSLSTERRIRTEHRLRAGDLKALVATASLELGIDIGPVELVCQVGSPRSIATFLQRVGRSNHSRHGTPKGRLWPLTRDELIESLALLHAVHQGQLDAICPPEAPLDILVQQIIAEAAADDHHTTDGLYELFTKAAPYANLTRAQFDEAVQQAAIGVVTGRGPRGAYLHYDSVNQEVRGRRGARLAALTSGGAIGENGDYRVVAEPDDTFIGTVNEDWAVESMAGDIFLLGSHSWRIKQVAAGTVRVIDAGDAPPTVPFWLGEAPARTAELSQQVSDLRARIHSLLPQSPDADPLDEEALNTATEQFALTHNTTNEIAEQAVTYIAAAQATLGTVPTKDDIVFERFFDDTGGQQLVVHSPYGGRINRGFGLALRKRLCRRFDFELQAAANDNAIILSLGPHHSFPLSDVPQFLHPDSVEEVLTQAVLDSPMFAARWRWNLNRALVVLRSRGGKRNPPPIQRMEADDIMAAVFPGAAACQENVAGPIEIPDHLLVRQTLHDTLHEALDVEGLTQLLSRIRSGEVRTHFCNTTEPSPLSHEIVNARPYAFLDDAELVDRRTNAVTVPRGLRPRQDRQPPTLDQSTLAQITPDAITQVIEEITPDPRTPDELHDLLTTQVITHPNPQWQELYEALEEKNRVQSLETPSNHLLWTTTELAETALNPNMATETIRGHLEATGPTTPEQLSAQTTLPITMVHQSLAALEAEGVAMRADHLPPVASSDRLLPEVLAGQGDDVGASSAVSAQHPPYQQKKGAAPTVGVVVGGRALGARRPDSMEDGGLSPDRTRHHAGGTQELWCARRLLQRMSYLSRRQKRQSVQAASPQDFMRFLLDWHHLTPDTTVRGRPGLTKVLEQLQGLDLPAGAWEQQIIAKRLPDYDPLWLDELCYRGELAWLRLTPPTTPAKANNMAPRKATPITLVFREDLSWLLAAARTASPATPETGPVQEIVELLESQGASFLPDLATATNRLPDDVERALWNGVALGLFTADGFAAVRALLNRSSRRPTRRPGPQPRSPALRTRAQRMNRTLTMRSPAQTHAAPGRWSLVPQPEQYPTEDLAEAVAQQLLACWGVVFRSLAHHPATPTATPWRDILKALRRFEDRGLVRGGRFVAGQSGEQFALPAAADQLQKARRRPRTSQQVTIAACDPLNLTGILFEGSRIPATPNNTLTYTDGLPDPSEGRQSA